jgi:8-oxo-dGTP pyrophosphatase MutT (NUDIX family)
LATLRDIRYQAAIIRDDCILLLQCAFRDGITAWILPGGGREEGEDELACVAREVREETGLTVQVEGLLSDVPTQPPDGTYSRLRTYHCTVLSGEAAPGGGEGPNAELTDVWWLPLDQATWPDAIVSDAFLYPQLVRLSATRARRDAGLSLTGE